MRSVNPSIEGSTIMDFDSAIASHAEWKATLRAAIDTKSVLNATSISRDDFCPFGRWLHGEAKRKYGHLQSFENCVCAHAALHEEIGAVARMINDKKYLEADLALDAGRVFHQASTAAGGAMTRLKREIAYSYV